MRDEKTYATVVACFAAGLYLAVLVAVFGLISLATDTEVIADPAVGPLVGPAMTGGAVLALLVCLVAVGVRLPGDRQRLAPLLCLGIGVVCYLAFVLAGAVVGMIGDPGRPLRSLLFAVGQLGSGYAFAVGLSAFVIALLYQLVLVGRFRQRGRLRWPWEGDDEE